MFDIMMFFAIIFLVELIILWYYFSYIEPKIKSIQNIVKTTGLKKQNARQFLKYVPSAYVKDIVQHQLNPEALDKLSHKLDLKDTAMLELIKRSEVLKGDDFLRWLENGFSLLEAVEFSNYGISMDSALICKNAGIVEPNFSILWEHKVSPETALQYLKSGIDPVKIVGILAEKLNLTPDERLFYVVSGIDLNDDIAFLLKNDVNIEILSQFKYWGKNTGKKILELTQKKKFSGEIYKKWRELGFSHKEMGLSFDNELKLEEVMEWRNHDFSVDEMIRYKSHGYSLERMINFRRKQRVKKD